MGTENEVETETLYVEEDEKIAFDPFVLCQKILNGAKASPMDPKLQSVFEQLKLRPQKLMMWAKVQYSKWMMIMRDSVPTTETSTAKQWTEYYSTFYQYTLSPVHFESRTQLFSETELNEGQTHFGASLPMEKQNELLQKERSHISEHQQPEP